MNRPPRCQRSLAAGGRGARTCRAGPGRRGRSLPKCHVARRSRVPPPPPVSIPRAAQRSVTDPRASALSTARAPRGACLHATQHRPGKPRVRPPGGLVAVVTLGLGVALASGAAGSTADAVRKALRPPAPAHDDTWAIGSATWGPLIRRYAPHVVLERDVYGEDESVPVDFAHCRAEGVRPLGVAPGGRVRPPGAAARRGVHPLLVLLPRLADHAPARRRASARTATTGRA